MEKAKIPSSASLSELGGVYLLVARAARGAGDPRRSAETRPSGAARAGSDDARVPAQLLDDAARHQAKSPASSGRRSGRGSDEAVEDEVARAEEPALLPLHAPRVHDVGALWRSSTSGARSGGSCRSPSIRTSRRR